MDNKSYINRALEFISSAWQDESINLDKVASAAGFSNAYFDRLFAENTGKPIMAYVRIYKLIRSAALLRTTNQSILDIALSLGYANPENYNRAFKAIYELSPSEYRQMNADVPLKWKETSTGTVVRRFEAVYPKLQRVNPEEYTQYDPQQVLEDFTEQFKKRYGVECVSALHHNKTKKNYHIHLIFSERRLLPEPEVKIATRSVFYDELGKRVRTKKEITGEDGKIREGCTVIKKGEAYEKHLFTAKDEVFKNELFLDEAKQFYTALINRHIHDPERQLKVFDPNSVYLPTKKIGKNNPKASEIEADNVARQDWNRTADMALVSGIEESKIIEVRNEHVYNEATRSVQKHGLLPGLFRGIIQKAKEILMGLIRETEVPPKPTLSIDMAEYRKMQKLMVKVQDEARAVKQLMHGELPKLEKQLAETTGLFKGKERRALQEKIAGIQQEIDHRMDRLPSILKEDGYPDVQVFKRLYDDATLLVEQYNRDLAAWERQVHGERPQQSPPEKESIRKKLRDMEAEAKHRNDTRRQEPRHRSHDYDRGR